MEIVRVRQHIPANPLPNIVFENLILTKLLENRVAQMGHGKFLFVINKPTPLSTDRLKEIAIKGDKEHTPPPSPTKYGQISDDRFE